MVIKGWTRSPTILGYVVVFELGSVGTKGLKVGQENIFHTITSPAAISIDTTQNVSKHSWCLHQILTLPSERCITYPDSSAAEGHLLQGLTCGVFKDAFLLILVVTRC